MKKIIFILTIFIALYLPINAQGDGETKEIYLSGNLLKLENLSLQYKSETKKGNFFRVGLTNLSFQSVKDYPSLSNSHTQTDFSLAFNLGFEKRKEIVEKLQLFYGVNIMIGGGFGRSMEDNPNVPRELRFTDHYSISPGLGFNSGFLLNIFKDFFIAAEVTPSVEYLYSNSQFINGLEKFTNTYNTGSFNFSNQNVRLSIVYRWLK